MKKILALVMLGAALFAAKRAEACSMCRSGDHSFFINSARMLQGGKLLFGIDHFNASKSGLVEHEHAEGSALAKYGAPLHITHGTAAASQVQNTVQASLQFGLSSRFMFSAQVPYVFNRLTVADDVVSGDGLGDPELTAMFAVVPGTFGKVQLNAQVGARVPLGTADLRDDNGVLVSHHVQPGSGAWAGIFGVQMLYVAGKLPFFAGVSYQANSANDDALAFGDVWRYNFAAQYALSPAVDLIGEVNGRYAGFDKEGVEADVNSGGSVIYASPGLRWNIFAGVALRAQVQIPIWERLHGVQDEDVNFRSGLIFTR